MDEILQIYRTYIFAAVNKESHINKNEKYTCSVCFYKTPSIATASAQLTIPKEYLPEVHGTIRGR